MMLVFLGIFSIIAPGFAAHGGSHGVVSTMVTSMAGTVVTGVAGDEVWAWA